MSNSPHYELLRELGRSPHFFTPSMQSELASLREQTRSGTARSDFPWERCDELGFSELISSLPDDRRDLHKALKQELVEKGNQLMLDILRHNSIAITVANATWHNSVNLQLKEKTQELELGMKQLEFLESQTKRIFDESADKENASVKTPTPAPPTAAAGAGASDVGGPATEWKDLLQTAAKHWTLDDLDKLLAKVGLLHDAASRAPTDDFRGAALAGIIKALRQQKYLKRSNTAKVAALLADRYGRDIANPNTIGRKYDPLPASAQAVYTCALAFLPAP